MIFEIAEEEFNKLTGGELMDVAAAILCQSKAVSWLAGDSAVGAVRRDKDRGETTFSWGAYMRRSSDFEFLDFGHDLPSHHLAMEQCIQCMENHENLKGESK
jgi:hypothetical protein